MPKAAPYSRLSPDLVLEAVESTGLACDGRVLALGSYENRVYQVGLEGDAPVVAKFYRPQRWTDAAIVEEHRFAQELAEADLPVVAPMQRLGATLHRHAGFRFALFPRRGGRWPELNAREDWVWLGRFLGRMHAIGGLRPFAQRPRLSVQAWARVPARELLSSDWIPPHLAASYGAVIADLIVWIQRAFDDLADVRILRIHGDCHRGNVLWTPEGPHFVDLDDCLMGPAVQDIWLFLAGSREEMTVQLGQFLEGYTQFQDFDGRELHLIEPLRTLRMIHHTAWIARRWEDPAFPQAFPWLGDARYWEQHVLDLKEQLAALQEPPLAIEN